MSPHRIRCIWPASVEPLNGRRVHEREEEEYSTETSIMFDGYLVVNLKFTQVEPNGVGVRENRGIYPCCGDEEGEAE